MTSFIRNVMMHWQRKFGPYVVEVDGVLIDFRSISSPSVRALLIKGRYEQDERRLLKKAVSKGDQVVELGAGIGLIGLIASNLAGSDGGVISYEANPSLEHVIRKNYSLNSLAPMLEMKAVDEFGVGVDLVVSKDILGSSAEKFPSGDNTKEIVASVALDEVVNQYKPDVLIMDIEGSEVSLLNCKSLDHVQRVLVEMHPRILGADICRNIEKVIIDRGFVPIDRAGDNILFGRQ